MDALNAPPVAIKGPAGGKSVTIVSALGASLELKTIGVVVFQNDYKKVDIDSWRLDEHVGSRLKATLSRQGRAGVVAAPRDAFEDLRKGAAWGEDPEKRIAEIVRGIVGTRQSDLIVVVTRTGSVIPNTNQAVAGIGVLMLNHIINRTAFHALFMIRVYDGRSFALLALRDGRLPDFNAMTARIRGPYRDVDNSWRPDPDTAANDQRLRSTILQILDEGLDHTLADAIKM